MCSSDKYWCVSVTYSLSCVSIVCILQRLSYLDRSTRSSLTRVITCCPSLSVKTPLLTQILHSLFDSYSILGIVIQMGEVLSKPLQVEFRVLVQSTSIKEVSRRRPPRKSLFSRPTLVISLPVVKSLSGDPELAVTVR